MKNLTSKIVLGSAVLALGTATVMCTWAQAQKDLAKDSSTRSYKIEVSGAKGWVDTDIDVRGGAKLRFDATGKITYPADQSYSGKLRTAGTFRPRWTSARIRRSSSRICSRNAGHGALVGRIGSESYVQPFLVGASKEYEAPVAGRLFLGINQSEKDASVATGSFEVKVEILKEGSGDARHRRTG